MKSSARNLLIGTFIMAGTFITAVLGYRLAGWTLLDSIYMVVITVFGVGYGEVGPMTPTLRVFTMAVILAGCTSLIYIVGGFIQFFTEGEIHRLLGRRRMSSEIDKLNNHVIICGFGRIGRILSENLLQASCKFVVVEPQPDRIAEAQSLGYLVCEGDATEEKILLSAGVERARVLATVLPNDASNVFITLSARNLNPTLEIIARGETPTTEGKLFQAGATRVVLPAHIGAERIGHQILHPSTEDLLENNAAMKQLDSQLGDLGIHIEEMDVPEDSNLVGSNLAQVETRSEAQFLVVAIHREDGQNIVHPRPDTVIQANDRLIFVCHRGAVVDFTRNKRLRRNVQYRGAAAN